MTHYTKHTMKHTLSSLLTYLFLLIASQAAHAVDYDINDSRSLGELKTGKGVFLVDIGDVIQGTHKGMKAQGVEPDFILVYIGPSVKYLSSEPSKETEQQVDAAVLLDIESNVEALAELGIRQEVCAVATRVFGIDNDTVFSEMTLIGDGFISLIGYQAQGYHLVPVF